MADDRSGDELGEEEDEEAVLAQGIEMAVAAAEVDKVGDFLEDEKADAERQDNVETRRWQTQRREVLEKEIGVFEEAERGEIDDDAEIEPEALPLLHEEPSEPPIDEGEPHQQRHEAHVPIAVIDERGGNEETDAGAAIPGERVVEAQRYRQEDEDENIGAEQHEPRVLADRCFEGQP